MRDARLRPWSKAINDETAPRYRILYAEAKLRTTRGARGCHGATLIHWLDPPQAFEINTSTPPERLRMAFTGSPLQGLPRSGLPAPKSTSQNGVVTCQFHWLMAPH